MKRGLVVRILAGVLVTGLCSGALFSTNYRFNLFGWKRFSCAAHISVDDTISVFEDLYKNESAYSSIFDNRILSFYKSVHDEYGCVFSLYCFYQKDGFDLSMLTNKFANEFSEHSSWLKFNYHALDEVQDPNLTSVSDFSNGYSKWHNAMKTVVGENSFDTTVRLSFFHGSKSVIDYMMSQGTDTFFAADDERLSYYLNDAQCREIRKAGQFVDEENGATFVNTDLRLDSSSDPFFDLFRSPQNKTFFEVFTHEFLITDSRTNSAKWKIKETCNFVKAYARGFSF